MMAKPKLTYSIDSEKALIYIECAGEISLEDLNANAKGLTSDPEFRPGMDELIDLSHATFNGGIAEASKYKDFLATTQDLRGASKWAIVAPTDEMYSLSRMFGMLTEGMSIRTETFRSRVSALAWLAKNREQ